VEGRKEGRGANTFLHAGRYRGGGTGSRNQLGCHWGEGAGLLLKQRPLLLYLLVRTLYVWSTYIFSFSSSFVRETNCAAAAAAAAEAV
jgi:hypothetical protein